MRWGNTGTFYYNSGDSLSGGTYLYLDSSQMPQYPVTESRITDRTEYRTKGGTLWSYSNYNLKQYELSWSLLDETCLGSMRQMLDTNPIVTFYSNGLNWGTFRFDGPFEAEEVQFELYDLNLTLVERS